MRRTVHMCVNINGLLKRDDELLGKLFTDNGVNRPGSEVREWLKLQLTEGKRVLPMGDCEGFDFQTGCPGHEIPEPDLMVTPTEGVC